eukprot:1008671-Pyramimonas_sp.AAC.1
MHQEPPAHLKLRKTTRGSGLRPTSHDEKFETSHNTVTAKHVDDINMDIIEDTVDKRVKRDEGTCGKCNFNKRTYTNCAVRNAKDSDGSATLDQDGYIKQLRLIQHRDLKSADAEAKASKMVADMFVSLSGALAYALITQVRLL